MTETDCLFTETDVLLSLLMFLLVSLFVQTIVCVCSHVSCCVDN